MWISREVDLPDALIDAQQKGHLVVFVGAGSHHVSCDYTCDCHAGAMLKYKSPTA